MSLKSCWASHASCQQSFPVATTQLIGFSWVFCLFHVYDAEIGFVKLSLGFRKIPVKND